MKYSYYTIDDLRLGYDPRGVTGWRLCRFLSLRDALEHYRALPVSGVKSIGLTNGIQVLELARHIPSHCGDSDGVDALTSDYRALPDWRLVPEAEKAVKICRSFLARSARKASVL